MGLLYSLIAWLIVSWVVGYFKPRLWVWTVASAVLFLVLEEMGWMAGVSSAVLWLIFLVIAVLYNIVPLRRNVITRGIFSVFRKMIPRMSKTEEEALNAGDTWWEAELFKGQPRWENLQELSITELTEEEQAFVDQETATLCSMIDDWQVVHHDKDLPENVWRYMKDAGFFGMVIDKKYGGKGFSASAHSAVVMKVATRSLSAAVTVMVPNSLGPGELLYHYGTEEQKDRYLPALAKGDEIPCFALTGPLAGSDASSMPDRGVVCRGMYQGEEVLGMKLTFSKRYITLAPVATLVGLAFQLYDPEGLLGDQEDIGITCCLVPRDHEGLNIGHRHVPLDMAFMNGTIHGEDMFVPLDWIIGGQEMAGQGWRMLVECLSIGRSISLPAVSAGFASLCYLTTGAYARVREQFKTPIGQFEGVEEALARIGGISYLIEATRRLTLTAVDQGIKPSVASAIAKYHLTELGRQALNDAMDIHGGRAIILGPRNYLGRGYQGMPICITVEGANILTRNLIIFGQGAMCCHPYIRKEFYAATHPNAKEGLVDFDQALFSHMGYLLGNTARMIWNGFTAGRLLRSPKSSVGHYYRELTRMSTNLSVVADVALLSLGGELKRKERLSARLGDVMSYLYLGSSVLKYFYDLREPKSERMYVDWALGYCLYEAQEALLGVLNNFPNKLLARVLRRFSFFWGLPYRSGNDRLDHKVAASMLDDSELRQRLSKVCYIKEDPEDVLGRMEHAFSAVLNASPVIDKLKEATREGRLERGLSVKERLEKAKTLEIITAAEAALLEAAEAARWEAIQVDDFKTV